MVLDQFTPVGLAELALTALTSLVGLYIGYQAYRGLRRHDSPPMRYLSAGFLLLFGLTYVTAFTGNALFRTGTVPLWYQGYFRLAVRVIQLAGVGCIAYSLYLTRNDGAVAR